jgi:hypothetical protein
MFVRIEGEGAAVLISAAALIVILREFFEKVYINKSPGQG